MSLPNGLKELIKKAKKPLKYVLFRVPKDMSLQEELDGVQIDMTDLKITSTERLAAIPDFLTNPERASACLLIPDKKDKDSLKCGPAFSAHVQIIRRDIPQGTKASKRERDASPEQQPVVKLKKELGTKSKSKRIKEL